MLVEQLKLLHNQAEWLKRVNAYYLDKSAPRLTLGALGDLIDRAETNNLTMTLSDSEKSKRCVRKTLDELNELYEAAQACDDRVKALIDSK